MADNWEQPRILYLSHFLHGAGHSRGGKDWKALKTRSRDCPWVGKSRRGESMAISRDSVNYSSGQ
jgi:hypothetical protein